MSLAIQQDIELDEPPIDATTIAVTGALANRYVMPEWALMFNVADQVGYNAKRFADAIAIGMWKSRGYELHGIEIKVSRADWLRELSNGRKAEAVAKYCDRWWIAAPLGIVNKDEVPGTWGLMELTKRGWRDTIRPAKLEAKPVDRLFLASLIRRSTERTDAEVQRRINKQIASEKASMERQIEERVKWRTRELSEADKRLRELVEAAGGELSIWDMSPALGKALKLIKPLLTHDHYGAGLENIANSARRTAQDIDALLGALKGLTPEKEESA